MSQEEIIDQSDKGNYYITGKTLPAPHLYCITPKHLEYNDSMCLGKEQIEQMEEKHGPMCGVPSCNEPYSAHGDALLVTCKKPMFRTPKVKEYWSDKKIATRELHQFLLKLKQRYGTKYVGFAFVDTKGEGMKK